MDQAEYFTLPTLRQPGLRHAFFTRRGGASTGVYDSLNGGVGSRDAPETVAENRARMAAALGLAPDRLVVPYQVHSAAAATISAPWAADARPRCDALVTATPGLALAVTGADCGMILFADAEARVIGAAHAGWKGALGGVVETTVAAMARLGAAPSRISATLGPCIAQASYEVGPEFVAAFAAADVGSARFFIPSVVEGRSMFDLHGYIGERAARAGVGDFVDSGLDTYADEALFFSYRRATHRREPDYGRLVSAIALV
jgi:YfiH family protein